SVELMELFAADSKLNTSKAYLRPGFAFGGSCLPKDLRALNTMAHDYYLQLPIISNIESSNFLQKKLVYDLVTATKEGTDDLRESPIIDVIESLMGKGFKIKVYDENVILSNIIGANKNFVFNRLPHIKNLMTDNAEKLLKESEVLIVNARFSEIVTKIAKSRTSKHVIDLIHIPELSKLKNYQGISW
ncbi:MAG: GDP-mannose dehydrogenase, partial [Bacteroidetes bacterium]|nr:GDP-mannose dehydrogenase [Bacteroidota bacterium]